MDRLATARTRGIARLAPKGAMPLVLVHGFGSDGDTFAGLIHALSPKRPVLAFDMPGHRRSLDWPRWGNAGVWAKALWQTLDARGIETVHLAGHSMGGATVAVAALMRPAAVRSLTMLAPGGFHPAINMRLMRRYATETDPERLHEVLESFFGFEQRVPTSLARVISGERRNPRIREALSTTLAAITDGRRQATLPLGALGRLPMPKGLVWGAEDLVVPIFHAESAPASIVLDRLESVGHMVHLEAHEQVRRILDQRMRAAEAAGA